MALVTLACGLLPVRAVAAEQAGVKVTAIEIRGNKRIELPAIAGRLTLKPGDPYTPENVRGQIKFLRNRVLKTCRWRQNQERAGGPGLCGPRETVYHRDRVRWNKELSDDKLKRRSRSRAKPFGSAAGQRVQKIRLAYQNGYSIAGDPGRATLTRIGSA
jgi:outer membrane protein insertion porin family